MTIEIMKLIHSGLGLCIENTRKNKIEFEKNFLNSKKFFHINNQEQEKTEESLEKILVDIINSGFQNNYKKLNYIIKNARI